MSYGSENSSYTKISRKLSQTPEAQTLLNDIINGFYGAEIIGHEFRLVKSDDCADARVVYKVKVGRRTISVVPEDTPSMIPHLSRFIDEKDLESIIRSYWGQSSFPRFFCKRSKVMEGGDNGIGFRRMMTQILMDTLEDGYAQKAASNSLLDQKAKLEASEDFQNERAAFLKKNATEDIGKVMKLYNHLGDDVLREALQDFVVNFTLEI